MTILIIVVLFFIAILLGLIALYMWYAAIKSSPRFEVRRRLRKLAIEQNEGLPADLRIKILIEMSPLDKLLYKFKQVRKLDGLIDKAGLKIDVKIFCLTILVMAASGFVIGLAMKRGIIFPVIFMLICGFIPFLYLQVKKAKRINQFTDQFSNALDMICRSLKAGHSLISAIQMVGNDMAEPVAGLFKTSYEEQTLGLSLKDALANMVERMNTTDLRFFATAVNIYREIGGNLSEILENLAHTIRERIKIRRQVRVYTAQGRLSGYILFLLPICMAVFFYFSAPGYIEELFNTKIGIYALVFAIIAQFAGFLIIRKIVNIRI